MLLVACALPLGACSVSAKQEVLETAFDERERRLELFEATLRVLDEHPGYVREFVSLSRDHRAALDRFFAEIAADLSDEELAQLNAKHLVDHPQSLRQVMIATLDASVEKPEAQRAISQAIAARPRLASRTIALRPETVRESFHALLIEVGKRPESRKAMLTAMQQDRAALADLLVDNPETARALMGALADAGLDELLETFETD